MSHFPREQPARPGQQWPGRDTATHTIWQPELPVSTVGGQKGNLLGGETGGRGSNGRLRGWGDGCPALGSRGKSTGGTAPMQLEAPPWGAYFPGAKKSHLNGSLRSKNATTSASPSGEQAGQRAGKPRRPPACRPRGPNSNFPLTPPPPTRVLTTRTVAWLQISADLTWISSSHSAVGRNK